VKGALECGARKADAAQRVHEHIGGGGEPETQRVGAERGCRESLGKETQPQFLDAVLALAPRTIAILVWRPCRPLLRRQRSDDEAWIRFLGGLLGLGDDASKATPTLFSCDR